jgi:hypothetical protein
MIWAMDMGLYWFSCVKICVFCDFFLDGLMEDLEFDFGVLDSVIRISITGVSFSSIENKKFDN